MINTARRQTDNPVELSEEEQEAVEAELEFVGAWSAGDHLKPAVPARSPRG